MTFQAYHRARRMGLALLDIRKGRTVLDSQLDQGFESGSGFRDAFNRLVGAAPSRAGDLAMLRARWLETPLGAMLAIADDRGLHLLDFVDRRGLERALAMLQKRLKARVLPGTHRHLDQIDAELREYFAGTRTTFATPVTLTGSAFQQRVWRELLAIPAGETRSYAALAARIGAPKAVRAVGRANGDNRLAIIVPCHRVIGSDGALVGYGGGLARKQKLLELERVRGAG
ncbi:MAG: methylated-DNA--[protein]-cysteine S-methyltransferase [Burkholderiales bacterium]|nr:methylated-DNA--[protein]-cysteine S-methyltransferase [Burkholderiales bacterium]